MTIATMPGVAPLADAYDAFVLDIWGVVMDGAAPYPGARECLLRLRESGKRVILLSNAPRRQSRVAERLAEIGIEPALYDRLISSGEASREALARPRAAPFTEFGHRYLYIGPERDADLLAGLDYRRAATAGAADFVLNAGTIEDTDTIDRFLPELRAARAANLDMVCANPDQIVVRHSGQRVLCAGAIAGAYERLGGTVHYFGKPHRQIYQACFEALDGVDSARVVAIGDNLDTDIAGAGAAGIATALVLGGVLAKDLGISWGSLAPAERITSLCARHGVMPDMAIPALVW